jgi:hypothetical protein
MAKSPIFVEHPYHFGEFAGCSGLRVDPEFRWRGYQFGAPDMDDVFEAYRGGHLPAATSGLPLLLRRSYSFLGSITFTLNSTTQSCCSS